jgi:hypothetical protein
MTLAACGQAAEGAGTTAAQGRDAILAAAVAGHPRRAARKPKQVVIFNGGHDIEEQFRPRVFGASFALLARHLCFGAGDRRGLAGPWRASPL